MTNASIMCPTLLINRIVFSFSHCFLVLAFSLPVRLRGFQTLLIWTKLVQLSSFSLCFLHLMKYISWEKFCRDWHDELITWLRLGYACLIAWFYSIQLFFSFWLLFSHNVCDITYFEPSVAPCFGYMHCQHVCLVKSIAVRLVVWFTLVAVPLIYPLIPCFYALGNRPSHLVLQQDIESFICFLCNEKCFLFFQKKFPDYLGQLPNFPDCYWCS